MARLAAAAAAARVAERARPLKQVPCFWKPFCSSESEEGGGITTLHNSKNGAQLYLLGSCHVSGRAALQTSKLINIVCPNVVAIELCKDRAIGIMENRKPIGLDDFARLPGDIEQKTLTLAAQHLENIMCTTGIEPGEEFKIAIEEGRRVGARIACIDEDFHDTMRKIRNALSMKDVLSCLADLKELPHKYPNYFQTLIIDDPQARVEAMVKPVSMREAVEFYSSYFPEPTKVLLHDRNELMVKHLRSFEGKIVAVVGLLHVDGIKELWKKAETA